MLVSFVLSIWRCNFVTEISISLFTILSFVCGAIIGCIVTIYVFRQKKRYEVVNISDNNSINFKLSGVVAELESRIKDLNKQLDDARIRESELKAEKVTSEAEYIKKVEEEKRIAYDVGAKDALKDYKITCQRFFYYKDGFFSKHSISGYKFQFFVKNIPVFDPINITVMEQKKFDEKVKETMLRAANQAIASIGKQLGGIPLEEASDVEEMELD